MGLALWGVVLHFQHLIYRKDEWLFDDIMDQVFERPNRDNLNAVMKYIPTLIQTSRCLSHYDHIPLVAINVSQ